MPMPSATATAFLREPRHQSHSRTPHPSRSNTSIHSSPRSLSPASSSTSSAFIESDSDNEADVESNSDTDVDPDNEGNHAREAIEEPYLYCLQSAMTVGTFVAGPCSMDAPWPYTFKKGDKAYARTSPDSWQLVTLLDSGHLSTFPTDLSYSVHPRPIVNPKAETIPSSPTLVYTAGWTDTSDETRRGTFCPTRGELKPDDLHVRKLLAREQERGTILSCRRTKNRSST